MTHPLKKAFQNAGISFKWGGKGNQEVYYRTSDMKLFREFATDKDASRVANELSGVDEFDHDDIYHIAQQVAWTWNNEVKANSYGVTTARRASTINLTSG